MVKLVKTMHIESMSIQAYENMSTNYSNYYKMNFTNQLMFQML